MNVKQDIASLGITPNKALGQNFLSDENAVGVIASAAVEPGLPLIEIGPGLGALTLRLAESGLKLAAVELDAALAGILRQRLEPFPNAQIITGDFLKTDLASIHASLGGGEVTAVGNLPYYVTSPICERLVCCGLPIRRMVLMMQKEAAERFFAREGDKNYVPLTVISRCLYDVERIAELGPGSYYPQPEVNSSVLLFERKAEALPKSMPALLKCAFAMRRKTLYNNLPALGITKQRASELIEKAGLAPSVRAEAVSAEKFIELCALYESLSEP